MRELKLAAKLSPRKNAVPSRASPLVGKIATVEDPVCSSSPPFLSRSPEVYHNSRSAEGNSNKPNYEGIVARTRNSPDVNKYLSKRSLSLDWWSSTPYLSSPSEVYQDEQNSRPAEGNSTAPDHEGIEARTKAAPDVNKALSKRPLSLDWWSSIPYLKLFRC